MTDQAVTPTEIYTAMGVLLTNNPSTQYMTVDVKQAVNDVIDKAITSLGWDDLTAAAEALGMAFSMGVEVGREIERSRAFQTQFGAEQ